MTSGFPFTMPSPMTVIVRVAPTGADVVLVDGGSVAADADAGRAELSGPAVMATARAAAPRAMPPTRVVGMIQGFMHVGRPCDGTWFPFARRFADAASRHASGLAHARQGGR